MNEKLEKQIDKVSFSRNGFFATKIGAAIAFAIAMNALELILIEKWKKSMISKKIFGLHDIFNVHRIRIVPFTPENNHVMSFLGTKRMKFLTYVNVQRTAIFIGPANLKRGRY